LSLPEKLIVARQAGMSDADAEALLYRDGGTIEDAAT